jgi:hypothetical protein
MSMVLSGYTSRNVYEYDWDHIRQCVARMQEDQGALMARMRDILFRYEGDYVIPMIDVENEPKMPKLSPALIGEAIDQTALRAASVAPTVSSPPLEYNKLTGKGSREFASLRSEAINACYERSRWKLGLRRYYRHLSAYHTASIVVTPDFDNEIPMIDVRDPLCSYVEPAAAESVRDPKYVGFVNRYSGKFLRHTFPASMSEYGGPITPQETTRLWEVLEWYDCECQVWGLLGPCDPYGVHINADLQKYTSEIDTSNGGWRYQSAGSRANMELARFHNKLGFPPGVMPHNVSLAGICSRIGAFLGNVDLQDKLLGLFTLSQEKAIFPDTYILGENGKTPELENDTWLDGRTGDVNKIRDASAVGVLRTTADPMTGQLLDRLERSFKTSNSLIAPQGGETYGALRTGRGIDSLASIALDPRIQELQEITEAYLPNMNKAILGTWKVHWGSKSYSMYCGYGASRKLTNFTPNEHFETFENSVTYFKAGADVMQLTQILGSLLGADTMSQRTFMENHPFIGNADLEMEQIRVEKLERAIIEALQQQVVAGQLPPTILADLLEAMRKPNADLAKVIKKLDQDLRELQATPAGPPPEGMQAPPEAMPGLTGGPAADQAPLATPIQTPVGSSNMRQLMQTMAGG